MIRFGIAAALAISAIPALAQDSPAVPQQQEEWTPEDDLMCAMFLSGVIGAMGENTDQSLQQGLASGVAYFVGRWEVARGGDLTEAMVALFPAVKSSDISVLGTDCGGRMAVMGQSLQVAGAAVGELEADDEADQESE
ncbi:MAG TPA: hypothetical protein DCS24_10485 [Erythrobacter sp.]|nr:hypothetical protein [Erythrobacter sp.]